MTSRSVSFMAIIGIIIKLASIALVVYVIWYLLHDPVAVGEWFGHIVSGFNSAK